MCPDPYSVSEYGFFGRIQAHIVVILCKGAFYA